MRRLTGVLIVIALAGCGGEAERAAAPKTPLAAMQAEGAKGLVKYCVSSELESEAAVVDWFNARQKRVQVRYVVAEDDGEERWSMTERLRRGDCDLAQVNEFVVPALAQEGVLADLTPYLQRRRKDFFPATLHGARHAGRDWGVPRSVDVRLLYYRPDEVSAVPRTWQDLYTGAGELDVLYPVDLEGAASSFLELSYAAGGRVLSPDGTKSVLDSPENRRALELLGAAARNGHTVPIDAEAHEEDIREVFDRDHGRFMINWDYALAYVDERKTDVEVAPVPAFAGGRRASLISTSTIVVSKASRNRAAAVAALDDFTSPVTAAQTAREFWELPATPAAYPRITDVPMATQAHQSMRHAHPYPVTTAPDAVLEMLAGMVAATLDGSMEPAEALSRASAGLDEALREAAPGDVS